ncbi:MAG: hypothetical protein HUU02_07290 [Bacteroidetes bacterium]|nr:hypothetical protein [Bacteroidota bacterium]
MNTPLLPPGIRHGISSAPNIVMSLGFLITWGAPTALGSDMLRYGMTVMILEFVTIHSAAFMGWTLFAGSGPVKKILWVIALGCFYSIFVYALAMESGEWWPMAAFWFLILNRLMTVLSGGEEANARLGVLMASWVWSLVSYLLAVMVTALLPLPAFGWTPEFRTMLAPRGTGLWIDEPQTLMAAGFLYFLSSAVFDLHAHKILNIFSGIDPRIPLLRKKR